MPTQESDNTERLGEAAASGRSVNMADGGTGEPERRLVELENENQALRLKLDRLRHTLDSAKDHAIVTLDLDGRISGWNDGARAVLGYLDTEILGRSGDLFFPAEDRAKGIFLGELDRAAQHGRAVNERWHIRRDGTRFWASGSMMPLVDGHGRAEGFLNILRDNTQVRAEDERRSLLLAELGHRIKNVMATVQAVTHLTLRQTQVSDEVRTALETRLAALSRSHDLLNREGWEGVPLIEIVQRALSAYDGTGRVRPNGPPLRLTPDVVEMLNLVFHELATNAAKYGALSVPDGRIQVSWTVKPAENGKQVVEVEWRERGGPPVSPPSRQGFGTRLLKESLTRKFGGTVDLDFGRDGLQCHIRLPGVIVSELGDQ